MFTFMKKVIKANLLTNVSNKWSQIQTFKQVIYCILIIVFEYASFGETAWRMTLSVFTPFSWPHQKNQKLYSLPVSSPHPPHQKNKTESQKSVSKTRVPQKSRFIQGNMKEMRRKAMVSSDFTTLTTKATGRDAKLSCSRCHCNSSSNWSAKDHCEPPNAEQGRWFKDLSKNFGELGIVNFKKSWQKKAKGNESTTRFFLHQSLWTSLQDPFLERARKSRKAFSERFSHQYILFIYQKSQ